MLRKAPRALAGNTRSPYMTDGSVISENGSMPTTKARSPAAFSLATSRARRTATTRRPQAAPRAQGRAGDAAAGHPRCGARRVRRARLRGGAARRRGGAGRRRQGHALSLFPRQGGAVRGAGARRRVASHRGREPGSERSGRPGPCRSRDLLRLVPEGGAGHQAQAAAAADHRRGPALSQDCRVLPSRGRLRAASP